MPLAVPLSIYCGAAAGCETSYALVTSFLLHSNTFSLVSYGFIFLI
jgi:hypothetical protein